MAKLLWSSPSTPKQTVPESALSRRAGAEPEDLCPADPNKTGPGMCGCGTAEAACTKANGLSAVYYQDFSGATVMRIDPTVNFSWGNGSPAPIIGADSFSVRWKGFVRAERWESHTFYTVSDDGIRLKVDGRVVVENWTRHGPTENRGTIAYASTDELEHVASVVSTQASRDADRAELGQLLPSVIELLSKP